MKKFFAVSILEVSLILMFVAVTSYFGWQAFTNKSFDLLKLSTVTQNSALHDINAFLSPLTAKLKSLMAYLNGNSSEKGSSAYNQTRSETTGVIGQLIAAYKQAKFAGASSLDQIKNTAIDALKDLILNDQGKTSDSATTEQKEAAENKAQACLDDPSSCTSLMTVTTISGNLNGVNPLSVYGGGKIPVSLNYTYTYVNDDGKQVTETVTQNVYIQKEQNDGSIIDGVQSPDNTGKMYVQFMPSYIQSKYNKTVATGSVTAVQALMNEYTTGQNSVLSKSKGQYYDFSTHTMYSSKNDYCSVTPDSCEE